MHSRFHPTWIQLVSWRQAMPNGSNERRKKTHERLIWTEHKHALDRFRNGTRCAHELYKIHGYKFYFAIFIYDDKHKSISCFPFERRVYWVHKQNIHRRMPNTIWNIAIATTQALVFSPQLTATTQSQSQSERYITCLSSSAVVHVALASSLHVDTHSPYRQDRMEKKAFTHTHYLFGRNFKRKTYLFIHCDCWVLSVCFSWWPQLHATKKPYFK